MGFRVLVTGATSPAGCAMLEALRDDSAELLACDSGPISASAELPAHECFRVHKNDDPEFVGDLVTLCVRHQVDVLVPMCGGDQLAVARVMQVFKRLGTRVWVAANPACATRADARRILQLAERNGAKPSVGDWFRRISRLGSEAREVA
jgi:nucleoside-diphosphate-sugar epimerase